VLFNGLALMEDIFQISTNDYLVRLSDVEIDICVTVWSGAQAHVNGEKPRYL